MSSLIPPLNRNETLVGLGDQDQPAGAGVDDVVDALAQRRAGRDHVERLQQSGVETSLEFMQLVPDMRRHRGSMMANSP